ncbi:hypothetical protein SAMN02745753_02207 [Marinomonas polaris DSM 16579]|uniref:DUF4145 domain-containing protein n=1 Tax=Marinomonas polaris DSM 16579 TaxID=1122206 RepID=A0A1M5CPN0_9GAMM|nr:hypothetical protein [Marinomonas polaris]SHF56714.1 hypothetical protein SAMN02745753_02207 [Marinomonas polaris DSM 16579]
METTKRQVQAFNRFLELLPHGKDKELVILKGHLLIEEQVWLILRQKLVNFSALKDAGLNCHGSICLAQSLFPSNHNPKIWKSIKKLNKLRNSIAHNIDLKGLNDKIDDFVQSASSGWDIEEDKDQNFELTLWSIFVQISSFVDDGLDEDIKLLFPE